MDSLKLKKTVWMRKRFVQAPLENLEEWLFVSQKFKEEIAQHSRFQIVGDKVVLAWTKAAKTGHVLFEVVGIPEEGFDTFDWEGPEVLTCDYPQDIFSADFSTLLSFADKVKNAVKEPLAETFYIVFHGQKIALHFFVQKDYIQT